MTIASEITRLQWAKADIKASIESKWVEVPASAKLDTYDDYISQIQGSTWYELFTPSTLIIEDAVYNSNGGVRWMENMWDTLSPDWNTYYHYIWYEDDSSTAYETYKIWVVTKRAWQNLWFTQGLTAIDERNVHWLQRVTSTRMKKDANNVYFSVLYIEEYDSDWHSVSWRTATYYCCNITNTTAQTVTLWTIPADGSETQAQIDTMYTAWGNSCWMTSSDVIGSLGLTSISLPRWSSSSRYNVQATINYN
jgi:hypothetical protein